MVITAALLVAFIAAALLGIHVVSVYNSEVSLRNRIAAKQKDNESEYDNMWKKIAQAAQVTDAQKAALLEIFRAHAEARGGSSGDTVVTWLKESVPDVDTTTFNNLQNIIAAGRDGFTLRQKELLELKQQHDSLLDSFPSGLYLSMLGREKIDVTIITSTRAEETFRTGTDDNLDIPFGEE
jgi:hypothetical protein